MGAPLANLIGILLRSPIVGGTALARTVYWVSPILAKPDGSVRFWTLTALTPSFGVSPLACSFKGSRSTMIWRYLPPAGVGKVTPGIGGSCCRRREIPYLEGWCARRVS